MKAILNDVQQTMLTKKIVLMGYKDECEEIYYAFRTLLPIEGYISLAKGKINTKNDLLFDNQSGLENLEKYSISQVNSDEFFIILCNGYIGVHWGNEDTEFDRLLATYSFEYEKSYIDAILLYSLPIFRQQITAWNLEKVVIFGCGKFAQTYYNRFKQNHNIVGFISNNENEQEFMGLPVHRVDKEYLSDKKIIICSVHRVEMMKQLEEMGKRIGMDYVTNRMLIQKLMLVIGTCHVCQPAEVLKYREALTVEYAMMSFLYTVHERQPVSYLVEKVKCLLKYADVVLYTKSIPGTEPYVDYQNYAISNGLNYQSIGIPVYCFYGLYPQYIPKGETFINDYCSRINMRNSWEYIWAFGDNNINRFVKEGKSEEEVVQEIQSRHIYSKDFILNNLNESFHIMEIYDMFSDIKISEFVKEHYKEKLLFRDFTHFTSYMMLEINRQILDLLGIEDDLTEAEKDDIEKQVIYGRYAFIYPEVVETLELDISELKEGYRCMDLNYQVQKENADTLIRKYYQYVSSVKKMMDNALI